MARLRWLVLYGLLLGVAVVYVADAREVCRPIGAGQDCREYIGLEDGIGFVIGAFLDWVGEFAAGMMEIVAGSVLSMLPDAPDLNLDVGGFVYGFSIFNQFLPLTEALGYTGLLVAAKSAGLIWRTAVTVYHLVPKPFLGT